MNPTPTKWYDRKWLVVILCIFLAPVGLFALWKSRTFGKIGKLIGSVVTICWFTLLFLQPEQPHKTVAKADNTAPAEVKPIEFTAAEKREALLARIKGQQELTFNAPSLLASFKANEVRADKALKGQQLYVEGVVEKVGKDITDDSYVLLKGDEYGILGVQCSLHDPEEAVNLNPGDYIAISGTCKGLLMNVQVSDARIVPTIADLKKEAKAMKGKK